MKFVKRDYWNRSADHRPYRNVCHEFVDGKEGVVGEDPMSKRHRERPHEVIPSLLDDLPDGTVFEVKIVPTGEVVGGGFQLVRPHHYEYVEEVKPRKFIRE